ncbi:MAG: class I fructose-bisphosphate aldolase [Hyphomonadaceae bacterium]
MNLDALNKVAEAMVAPGRGILAADESTGTIKKRFDAIGVENSEENRRDYRELMFRAKEAMQYVSGVILYDETIWQKARDGDALVKLITDAGSIPGIKVDEGTRPLSGARDGELVTKGLDGLDKRLPKYHEQGARFAKWRAVIDPTNLSYAGVLANAHALARYANLCQEFDIVPIVEPEVLMDGDNSIETNYEVTEWVLKETFQQLYYLNVKLEGIVLKPNMIVPGKKAAKQASVDEVAEQTIKCLKACVPSAVPGIAYLSGGQSDVGATAHLNRMNQIGGFPWKMTFSSAARCKRRRKRRGRASRKCRGGAERLPAPRAHERPRQPRQVERSAGKRRVSTHCLKARQRFSNFPVRLSCA